MRVIMPQKENNGFAKALTKFLTTILAPTVFNRNEQKIFSEPLYNTMKYADLTVYNGASAESMVGILVEFKSTNNSIEVVTED